ncbi:DUF6119 family protein [Amycolatopsis eburnea]|uniref:DUF6119 family protein n=1 Tax=Amycolatopsis eburnea TaxID=2267691 RepID=UPI001315ABA1|nr:DUF6119 family protein [Amycolatopsis eburnea]
MQITLNLLRSGIELSRALLREATRFREIDVHPPNVEGVNWRLFVRSKPAKPAAWTQSVASIVVDPSGLSRLRTQSSAGVLLVGLQDRVFAVTFGTGHHALEPVTVEPGFGLRVTANVVAHDRVTSANTKGFNRSARSQKTILPAASAFADLGVEPAEEWIRQLSGRVTDNAFASTVEGSDSLRLNIKEFSLRGLPVKLHQIMSHYENDAYRETFPFLDNFIRLGRDDPVVGGLDAAVAELVRSRDASVAFAAPDPFEQLAIHHYRIGYYQHVDLDELTTDSVYEVLEEFEQYDDVLQKVKVRALNEDSEDVDRRYSLYDYVQVEVDHADGGRYALTSGSWFRIDRDYLAEVDEYVEGMADLTADLDLADWDPAALKPKKKSDTAEGLYNERLARDRKWQLLDKENLVYSRYQRIEVCDVLTPDRQLLCVKNATKSSTLSHLFAQGSVSASSMHEAKYQNHLMGFMRRLDRSAQYGRREDWTFVYAIATAKLGPVGKSLFFFSKLNLVIHARQIEALGYRVALAKIQMV